MTSLSPAAMRAQTAYQAAADHYDGPALAFWDRFGRATVERLELRAGDRVLDVCCGSGASALPAAEAVGPAGRVMGVDLAAGLLELARTKAKERRLAQVEFRQGDLEQLGEPSESFDAVVCVFGIFFVPDMAGAVRHLWRFVRPGGRLAITTWGPRVFEPGNTIFWDAIKTVRPELYKGFNPWDRISTPAAVTALLQEGGAAGVWAEAETGSHPLRAPADWWAIVMGSGYRGIVEQLSLDDIVRVMDLVMAGIRQANVRQVETNVVYAQALKR